MLPPFRPDLIAWALILARVAGLAWTAPAWGTIALGLRFRLILAGLITALLIPAVGPTVAAPSGGPAALAGAFIGELAVGIGLGLPAALVIAGARQAGELVGAQAGLSPASLLDPEAGDELTPLGHLYGLVALGVFLTLDGPTALVGSLVESFRAVPAGSALRLGSSHALSGATDWAFGRVGWALALAIRAAAPVAVALGLAGVALGLLGRAAPTFQRLGLSLPIRAALGIVGVLLGLWTLVAALSSAFPLAAGGSSPY